MSEGAFPAKPRARDRGTERHYGMDWLRIGAFFFLILYHIGLAFGPWPFEIKVAKPINFVTLPLLALNAWRLPLLFLVSGYASSALARRTPRPGTFARERLARLGIPLLFAMVVLVTPQPWVTLVTQHGYTHGFGYFLVHDYFTFKDIEGVRMPTWMHLWFVAYLIVYSLLLAAGLKLFASKGERIRRGVERLLGGWWLLVLPTLYVFLVRWLLPPGWTDTHGLIGDWSAHAAYFSTFLFGFVLQRSSALQQAIDDQWRIALFAGIAGFAFIAAAEVRWPGNTPLPKDLVLPFMLARAFQCWGIVVALVGIANRYLDHDSPRWRPMLAEAVFPFYIIHQTIIVVVGYWLLGTPTTPFVRFVALVAATAVGCWLFYAVGRRIGWLRPLIGLRRRPKTVAPALAEVPA